VRGTVHDLAVTGCEQMPCDKDCRLISLNLQKAYKRLILRCHGAVEEKETEVAAKPEIVAEEHTAAEHIAAEPTPIAEAETEAPKETAGEAGHHMSMILNISKDTLRCDKRCGRSPCAALK
jgi:hypothetical protein